MHVGATDKPDALVVAANREFLLKPLQTGNQLTLCLDGPLAPLAIRDPDRDGTVRSSCLFDSTSLPYRRSMRQAE